MLLLEPLRLLLTDLGGHVGRLLERVDKEEEKSNSLPRALQAMIYLYYADQIAAATREYQTKYTCGVRA